MLSVLDMTERSLTMKVNKTAYGNHRLSHVHCDL